VVKKVGAVALLGLGGLLAACNSGGSATPPTTLLPPSVSFRGEVTVSGANNVRGSLSECAGAGRFADMAVGAPVTVTNPKGKALGIGKVQYAVGTNVYQGHLDQCTFRYFVVSVKTAKMFYVRVGQQKAVPVLASYLVANRYNFAYTLTPTTTTPPLTNPLNPPTAVPPITAKR
jgi:hypothetical protein